MLALTKIGISSANKVNIENTCVCVTRSDN